MGHSTSMSSTRPALPPVGRLTEQQVRGTACVYCGVRLDDATAVALGPRRLRRLDMVVRWFPRACQGCAGM